MLIFLKSLACSDRFFVAQAKWVGYGVVWYIGDEARASGRSYSVGVVHYVYNQYIINVVGSTTRA